MKENNKEQTNKDYKINAKGSLGLLAYGDIGLKAWREVRDNFEKSYENK